MKKVLKFSFIAAVAVAAGYTAYSHSQKEEVLSDLMLANVEMLAYGESGSYSYHVYPCNHAPWNECVYSPSSQRPACSSPSYC